MNKFKKKSILGSSKGFTLLELLVVVAIIGILAGVVGMLLSNARKSGDEAAVQTNLRTIANQAEIFYLDNGNSYLPLKGGNILNNGECPSKYNESADNMFARDKIIADALAEAIKRGDTSTSVDSSCYNSSAGWAVAIPLRASNSSYWCVDSTRAARIIYRTGKNWAPLIPSGTEQVCNN